MRSIRLNMIREFMGSERTLLTTLSWLILAAVLTAIVCETSAITRLIAAYQGLDLKLAGNEIVGLRG